MSNDWQNGLCGCFNDITLCIITYIVPCYTHGKNAEVVGDNCFLCALAFFVPFLNIFSLTSVRGKIREKQGIEGSCISDCLLTTFCTLCTLVQQGQEVKALGGQAVDQSAIERN